MDIEKINNAFKLVHEVTENAYHEAKIQSQIILNITKDNQKDPISNKFKVDDFCRWLKTKRLFFPDQEWKNLINKLISLISLEICKMVCPETNKRLAIVDLLQSKVLILTSNDDFYFLANDIERIILHMK